MPHPIDMTGQRFGKWTVIARSARSEKRRCVFWDCQCDCGTKRAVAGSNLRNSTSSNCGCERERTRYVVDLAGQRFGKWTVLQRGPVGRKGDSAQWICRCDCGKERGVRSTNLRNGISSGCGCARNWTHNTYPSDDIRVYIGRYNAYADKARRRLLTFDLSLDEFVMLAKQDCLYCGTAPALKIRRERVRGVSPLMNGIDRVDNSVGYVLDNCVPCCTWCNEMKRHRPQSDFLEHVRRIAQHSNDK